MVLLGIGKLGGVEIRGVLEVLGKLGKLLMLLLGGGGEDLDWNFEGLD